MAARERPVDRGQRLGVASLRRLGEEVRAARTGAGLSIDTVAAAVGISNAEVSRIERGGSPKVPLITLSRLAAIAGLDLVTRLYPGPSPLRDQAHGRLLGDLRARLHPSLRWAAEVPMPIPGDQRAWDGMIFGSDWRFAVEAETAPQDGQALTRRLALKLRDGGVDGLLLLVRDTARGRSFVAATRDLLDPLFPVPGRRALASLRDGRRPEGNAIIVLAYAARAGRGFDV